MEASLEHMRRNTVRHIDTLLVITEPYFRSLESARRLFKLASEIPIKNVFGVANKVRTDSEKTAISQFFEQKNLPLLCTIPYDDNIRQADLNACALIDFCDDSPAIVAIAELLQKLLTTEK
jgi:CO dehydrogenase maturation factor